MSALAARRAAAAASTPASGSSTPAKSATDFEPAQSKRRRLDTSRHDTSSTTKRAPRSPSALSESDDESVSIAIPESSSKRHRVANSPPAKQRYFVQPVSTSDKGKQRAFSPSVPVETDSESESADDGSSAPESDDEEVTGIVDEVENGRVRWDAGVSAPSTPRYIDRDPGPSRFEVGTSKIKIQEGVNMLRLSEDQLAEAGFGGSGPGVLLSMRAEENIMIAGIYTVTPIQGSLRIFSTILPPSATGHPVFAPTSHPVPIIEPVESSVTDKSTSLARLAPPSTFSTHDEKTPRTMLLIRGLSTGLEGLREGAVPGFGQAWLGQPSPWGLKNVYPVIRSFAAPVYPYVSPSSWIEALDSLRAAGTQEEDLTPPVVLVKGPKRTGKSTMARAALNDLLGLYDQVAWLECDLGQGEFGPGGMVGLWVLDRPVFGPPFSHPRTPHRAHYLGTYTSITCPDEYMAAIRHLLEVFKYEIQYPLANSSSSSASKRTDIVPLVINTQGWVKGLGEELLRGIESISAPSHVFAFDSPAMLGYEDDAANRSPSYAPIALPAETMGTGEPAKLFVLEPAPISPLQARYTSADMRILSMITYLHANSGTATWNFDVPLPAIAPLETRIGSTEVIREVYLIGEGSEGIEKDDLGLALNGAIVAMGRNDSPSDHFYRIGRPVPIHDDTTVFGLGLIRGIESADEGYKIRLITPLDGDALSRVNCIVKNGAIELPICGLMDWRDKQSRSSGAGERIWGMDIGDVPFLQRAGGGGVGVERKRVRRNLQRRNV